MFALKTAFALLILFSTDVLVNCLYDVQPDPYHAPQPVQEFVTTTQYWTDTRVHTVRLTSTSDVHQTINTVEWHTVTQFATERDFVQGDARTLISTLWVTNTPVILNTVEVAQNANRNLYAEVTRFVTHTQKVQRWSTLTHVQVQNQVRTIPVITTETLRQRILDTATQFITITVTSTTRGYY